MTPTSTVLPVHDWAGSAHTAVVLKAGIRLGYVSRDSLLEARDRQQESMRARFRVGGKYPVPCVLSLVGFLAFSSFLSIILYVCLADRTGVYGWCLLLDK